MVDKSLDFKKSGSQSNLAKSLDLLSPREIEVLVLIMSGLNDPEIADELFITPRTVRSHIASIFDKLRVKNRVSAAVVGAYGWPEARERCYLRLTRFSNDLVRD